MAIVLNSILEVLELIDSKVTLVLCMDFNGDIGMLHIQQNRQITQDKELINSHGSLMKLNVTLQVEDLY